MLTSISGLCWLRHFVKTKTMPVRQLQAVPYSLARLSQLVCYTLWSGKNNGTPCTNGCLVCCKITGKRSVYVGDVVTPRVFKPKQVKIGDFDDAGVREGVVVAVPECLAGPGGAVAVFGRATRKLHGVAGSFDVGSGWELATLAVLMLVRPTVGTNAPLVWVLNAQVGIVTGVQCRSRKVDTGASFWKDCIWCTTCWAAGDVGVSNLANTVRLHICRSLI